MATRTGRRIAVIAAVVVVSVGGCAWNERSASAALRAELPPRMVAAGFETMPDWRSIGHPPEDVRSSFTVDGSTYRVVDSDVDDATLAVWRTGPQGAQPMYNETRVATGSACVSLHRTPAGVSADVVDCPVPLSDTAPWPDDDSWGQDAVAVASAAAAIDAATEEVRRTLISEPDGRPRTSDRTAADLVSAAEADRSLYASTIVAAPVVQTGRSVTLTLTATATTPEAVDTTRTASARWCAQLRVDLDDHHPNVIGDEGPCR